MKSRSDADKHTAEQIFNSFIEGEQAYDGITDNPVRAIISKFVEAKSGIESNGSQQNTEANVALYLVCKYAGTKKRHVETLIKSYDADPDYVLEGNTGDSPLHLVASRCDSLGAVIALLEAGADVNRVNKRGRSPLIIACDSSSTSSKRLDIIRHMSKWRGIDIEKTDNANRTACFYAASVSNFWIMRELFLAGASVMPKSEPVGAFSRPVTARGLSSSSSQKDGHQGQNVEKDDDEGSGAGGVSGDGSFPYVSPLELTSAMAKRKISHSRCLPRSLTRPLAPTTVISRTKSAASPATSAFRRNRDLAGGGGAGASDSNHRDALSVDAKIVCGVDVSSFKLDSTVGRYESYFDVLSSSLLLSKEVLCYNMTVRRCCEELRERRNEAMRLKRLQGAGTTLALSPSIPLKRLSVFSNNESASSSPLKPSAIELSVQLPMLGPPSRPTSARPTSRGGRHRTNHLLSPVVSPRQVALTERNLSQLFRNVDGSQQPTQNVEQQQPSFQDALDAILGVAAAGGGGGEDGQGGKAAAAGGGGGGVKGGITSRSYSSSKAKEEGYQGDLSQNALGEGLQTTADGGEETLHRRRLARKAERAKKRKDRVQNEKKKEWKDMRIAMAQKVDSRYTQKIRLRDGEEEHELYEAVLDLHRQQEEEEQKQKDMDEKERRKLERKQRKKQQGNKRKDETTSDSAGSPSKSGVAWETAKLVVRPSKMDVDELFKNLEDEVIEGVNELAGGRGGSAAATTATATATTAAGRQRRTITHARDPKAAVTPGVAPIAEEDVEDDAAGGDDDQESEEEKEGGDIAATHSDKNKVAKATNGDDETSATVVTESRPLSGTSTSSGRALPLPTNPCPAARPPSSGSRPSSSGTFQRPASSSSRASNSISSMQASRSTSSFLQPTNDSLKADSRQNRSSAADAGLDISAAASRPTTTGGPSVLRSMSSPQRASSAILGSRAAVLADRDADINIDGSKPGVGRLLLSQTLPSRSGAVSGITESGLPPLGRSQRNAAARRHPKKRKTKARLEVPESLSDSSGGSESDSSVTSSDEDISDLASRSKSNQGSRPHSQSGRSVNSRERERPKRDDHDDHDGNKHVHGRAANTGTRLKEKRDYDSDNIPTELC